jgi:hypothetical protein
VFEVKEFHKYLYGRQFTLITDSKPFVAILGPKSGIPPDAAARMQRWAMILPGYHYDIEYRRSVDHCNADALSRLPLPVEDEPDDREVYRISYVDDLPVTSRDSLKATHGAY